MDIQGTDESEILTGSDEDDTIEGGGGNDQITGGTGDDDISDTSGDEIYYYNLGDGGDTISDLSGYDAIQFGNGISRDDVSFLRDGSDDLIFAIGSQTLVGATDFIRLSGVFSNPDAKIEELRFQSGVVINVGQVGASEQEGTGNDDLLVGGDEDDNLDGTGGADTFVGGPGSDTYVGGPGNDTFILDAGFDSVSGGGGSDTVVYQGSGSEPITLTFFPGATPPDEDAPEIILQGGGENPGAEIKEVEKVKLRDDKDVLIIKDDGPSGDLIGPRTQIDLGESTDDDLIFDDESIFGEDGIFYRNGDIQLADPSLTQSYIKTNGLFIRQPQEVNSLLEDEYYAEPDRGLYFTNVDNVTLTNSDDRFSITSADESTHSGTGEIKGLAGRDVFFVSDIADGDLTIDGGADGDIIIVSGGTAVTTIGGLGRDLIINTTPGGKLYGDSVSNTVVDEDGNVTGVEEDGSNADHFWFAPNTTIFDPQRDDILSFYGVPLVGGDATATAVGWALGGGGPLAAVSGVVLNGVAAAAVFQSFSGGPQLSFDVFLPNIIYLDVKVGGETNLIVTNMTDILFNIVLGGTAPSEVSFGDGAPSFEGIQTVRNFTAVTKDFEFSSGAFDPLNDAGGFLSLAASLVNDTGDLGMLFNYPSAFSIIMSAAKGLAGEVAKMTPAVGLLFKAWELWTIADGVAWLGGSAVRLAKNIQWALDEDPLIIDLDGDGIETIAMEDSGVFFDVDNDLFAELTAWVDSDDGFLVRDVNDNGRIDNISEMFGTQFGSGYADLAFHDLIENGGNADGKITAADLIWAELQIWRDLNTNGTTEEGELQSLDALGIVALDLNNEELGVTTPQDVELLSSGLVEFSDGTVTRLYEALFPSLDTRTKFAGEAGFGAWQQGQQVESKGYGSTTDLSVAIANDFTLGEIVSAASSSMTIPDFADLREKVGDVLGYWGQTMETTRELTPILLGEEADGTVSLLDRGVYVEDDLGGYWTLHSGNAITDADGNAIDRPTMEDLLAQTTLADQAWQIEQTWSPVGRAEEVEFRESAPYLMRIVEGRAVIDDYGIQNEDGSWRLASGREIVDENGVLIASPTVEDIIALSRDAGQEWRVEEIGFNPYADIPVETIAVRFADGIPLDYTVEVTDQDGTFLVWARNLDRALELQFKTGDSREFALRNFEINLDTLDEVNSSLDSTYRVELLTPGQFQFATSLSGFDFREEMLTATLDNTTGLIDYRVVEGGSYTASEDEFVSVIDPMIEMVGYALQQYIVVSARLAVRIALQDGLSEFARDIEYVLEEDAYRPTSSLGLVPMFEAIFESAPASNENDAVVDYLTQWNVILAQIYPDYKPADPKFFFDAELNLDQAGIFQTALAAAESTPVDLDILALANVFSVEETRIVSHEETDTEVFGKDGVNYFHLTEGNQYIVGSYAADAEVFDDSVQSDIYFVSGNAGDDTILDRDLGDHDQLRFTTLKSDEVEFVRDGEDLIIFYNDGANFIRLNDQFLGERNTLLLDGSRVQSGVDEVIFADGVVLDRFRLSFEVVDFERAALDEADAYFGSGSGDILYGGLGNDFLSGGAGGDTYIIEVGHGHDVIDDLGNFSFGPLQAGLDFLNFRGDITEDTIRLTRDGNSDNLLITLLDLEGNETGDSVEIVGQFGGLSINLGAFAEAIGSEAGLDYVAPNLIEKIFFEKGGLLDFEDIQRRVLENAKTDGDDAIYGFLNANTLDGGAGDDFLTGQEGFDTYIFGRDYGADVILDADFASSLFGSKDDLLKFEDDLRWTDFTFLRDGDGDTLTLQVTGTDSSVTMTDYLENIFLVGYINLIEDIEFADGTVWNYLKLLNHYLEIAKTDGDDVIYGFETISDRLDGGAGNDRLEGQSGDDTYVFGIGYGTDTISDQSGVLFSAAGSDRIEFKDLLSSDIEFSRTSLDLILKIKGTEDQIILENQYVRANQQSYAIEFFQFGDRTLEFTDFNPEDLDLVGTNDAETITGSNFAETIDGRGGDDTLIGGDGGDTYLFDVGYGEDIIVDTRIRAAWNDREGVYVPVDDIVKFGDDITQANAVFTKDGDDLVISVSGLNDTLRIRNQFLDIDNGIERFEFSDGTFLLISDVEEILQIEGGNRGDNIIEGNPTNPNTLDGRQGDDTLIGGSAADTYAFGADYDFDRIEEKADAAGVIDRVQFGASVTRDLLKITRDGDDLIIDLGNGADILTIVGGLGSTRVEEFRFGDGMILTLDEIIDRMLTGGESDEEIIGLDNRDDTLSGGGGSDALLGGDGDDTYLFGFGDGSDSIEDSAGIDRLVFGTSVLATGVTFEDVDGTLLIRLNATGERIAVLGGYRANVIEVFEFADGEELSIEDVRAQIRSTMTNMSQDIVETGQFETGFPLEAGTGHDLIILSQDAVAIFNPGDQIDRFEMATGATVASIRIPEFPSSIAEVRIADGESDDLIIAFPDTGDQLVIVGARGAGAVPTIEFRDGVIWDAAALVQQSIDGQGSDGDDLIRGSDRADVIVAGLGDDLLIGGRGNDVYQYQRGDGQDVIEDEAGFDRLEITGYRPDEIRVERLSADRNDLILTFEDEDDILIIRFAVIDEVAFSDGTIWTRDTLFDLANAIGSDTDDVLSGTAGSENFRPGFGNDIIIDGRGGDVYNFARGDGQDRITTNGNADGFGVIAFDASITLEDVTAKRDADGNIILLISGGDDRLTLIDPVSDPDAIVGTLEFADGRSISVMALARAIPATDGDDHIIAASGPLAEGIEPSSNLFGRDGNDWLETGRGNDVLQGDLGNDLLQGHSGSDVYVFGLGDGQDTIADIEQLSGAAIDTIRFEAGIAPADIEFLSVGPVDLVVGIVGTQDRLTIKDMFGSGGVDRQIEQFEFASGETWDLAEIISRATTGSGQDDTIDLGTVLSADIVMAGGTGDDLLAGGRGDTTYAFNPGDGHDEIIEAENWASSDDTLEFGAGFELADLVVVQSGDDLVVRFVGSDDQVLVRNQFLFSNAPINSFLFDNGTNLTSAEVAAQLVTEEEAQRLLSPSVADENPFFDPLFSRDIGNGEDPDDGPGGDDENLAETLTGTPGVVDTFAFFVPQVDDSAALTTIVDFETGDTGDKLDIVLAAGLIGTVVARQEGADSYIYFMDEGETNIDDGRLLIRLQSVLVADLTLGNFNGAPFESADPVTLTGTNDPESLTGGWGDDTITALRGADTLEGQEGNDTLSGGNESDIYLFDVGFGQDVVSDNGTASGSTADVISFGPGLVLEDLRVRAEGNDLVLSFVGTEDSIRILNTLSNANFRIEILQFSDGRTLSHEDLVATAFAASDADQTIVGSYNEETLDGGGGNDNITGRDGADTIIGGTGNDFLSGGNRNDTYVFEAGFGQDIVSDSGWSNQSGADVITFGDGIVLEDLRVRADGNDLVLTLVGTEDRIRIENTLTNADFRIETVTFADGRSLTHDALVNMALAPSDADQTLSGTYGVDVIDGGGGNDTIFGLDSADTLIGGTGNDFLSGGNRNDTYVFEAGFGQDIVSDNGWSNQSGADVISFGPGIVLEDLRAEIDDNDLVLTFVGSDDRIRIENTISNANFRIESVLFDDGRSLTHDDLTALAWAPTDADQELTGGYGAETLDGGGGNDTIFGLDSADTLIGGTGNDFLSGGNRNDTYVFEAGFGQDIVSDNGWSNQSGADVISFGPGISIDDLLVRADGSNLILSFVGTEDRIEIQSALSNANFIIDSVVFDDGQTLTHAELVARIVSATEGDDVIIGSGVADTLDGLGGDDLINGGAQTIP